MFVRSILKRNISSNAKAKRFVLLGMPGAGKGTQGEWLARDYKLAKLSTGDMLRDSVAKGDEEVAKILKAGALVDDATVLRLLDAELARVSSADAGYDGWFLDGFPRNLDQANALHSRLASRSTPLTGVFFISVDPEVIWEERIKDRWVHAPSGRTYHTKFNPPRVAGKDDETGEPLVQREDDKRETVMARFDAYMRSTKPLLDYYEKQSLLHTIDSPNSPTGYSRLKALLKELGHEQLVFVEEKKYNV